MAENDWTEAKVHEGIPFPVAVPEHGAIRWQGGFEDGTWVDLDPSVSSAMPRWRYRVVADSSREHTRPMAAVCADAGCQRERSLGHRCNREQHGDYDCELISLARVERPDLLEVFWPDKPGRVTSHPEETAGPFLEFWLDLEAIVVWRCASPHWLEFVVVEGGFSGDGKPCYLKDGESVDRTEEAGMDLSGFVKWDGCAEIDGSGHFCGREDLRRHTELMLRLYDLGKLLPGWHGNGDEQR